MEREAKRLANAVWFDGLTLDRHLDQLKVSPTKSLDQFKYFDYCRNIETINTVHV